MKYIKRFSTLSGQTEYLTNEELDTYVGYVDETQNVYYDDAIPEYKDRYFTIKSLADNNVIYFRKNSNSNVTSLYTSTDGGNSWSLVTPQASSNQVIATLNAGEKLLIKGENTKYYYSRFSTSGQFKVYGNIMSLISGDSFANADTITDTGAFSGLFSGATDLTSAENIILPATTLTSECYKEMFHNCANLTASPVLPATTLASSCYGYMFAGCSSLTAAPQLPASVMTNSCYDTMFRGCTSLTSAPELPATTLADYCYIAMFSGCTSLTTAPELSATTLATACYLNMLNGCINLNYIKCLATNISATNCTRDWVNGVANTGAFVKAASMNDWTTGTSGIPTGWTTENDDGSPVGGNDWEE